MNYIVIFKNVHYNIEIIGNYCYRKGIYILSTFRLNIQYIKPHLFS